MAENKNVSRRDFLKNSGVLAGSAVLGATLLGGCTQPAQTPAASAQGIEPWVTTHEPPANWDRTCEVLVIGGGGGGCFAALEAHAAGSEVLLLEASDVLRGETAICGGGFGGCQTSIQKAQGFEDDPDLFVADWLEAGDEFNDPEIIRMVVEKSGETIERLIGYGAKFMLFDPPGKYGHTAVPRVHWCLPMGSGKPVMEVLQATIAKEGVEVLYKTPAQKLYRQANGRVVGALAQDASGNHINIEASKAVVLACGGPGADFNLLENYMPVLKHLRAKSTKFLCGTWPMNLGTIFADAVAIGAAYSNFAPYYSAAMTEAGITYSEGTEAGLMIPPVLFSQEGSICVSSEGKRFANEEDANQMIGRGNWTKLPGMSIACIMDSIILDLPSTKIFVKDRLGIDKLIADGNKSVAKADTVEELAGKLGIDPAELKNTVEKWNEYAAAESDPDFGRKNLGPGIKAPPYYGVNIYAQISMLKGGIKVNTKCQVLDNYAKPIPGLYAAGEIASGQVQGSARIHLGGGGTAIALSMGLISGKNAAAETV